MDSYQRFNRTVFEWQRATFKIVGHDFFGEKFELNLMSFVIYFLMTMAVLTMAYSAIFYDPLTKIFNLIFFLIAFQVIHIPFISNTFLPFINLHTFCF